MIGWVFFNKLKEKNERKKYWLISLWALMITVKITYGMGTGRGNGTAKRYFFRWRRRMPPSFFNILILRSLPWASELGRDEKRTKATSARVMRRVNCFMVTKSEDARDECKKRCKLLLLLRWGWMSEWWPREGTLLSLYGLACGRKWRRQERGREKRRRK